MPKLKELLYKLERLMQMYLPDVYTILQAKEMPCELFSIQWFLTLFSLDFDPDTIIRVWDIFLMRKWKFLFQLSISILKHMAKKIEELNYENLIIYLKSAIAKNLLPKVNLILRYRKRL